MHHRVPRVFLVLPFIAAVAVSFTLAGTVSVKVNTSRGEYDLLVFAPTAPAPQADRSSAPPLVLLISGEGGWRSFDDLIAGFLSDSGYWVGGLDAMKYFWTPQDDRRVLAADLRACVSALAAEARRDAKAPVLLAGFSFGADLAPWVAGAPGWEDRVLGLVMISPDETGSLEFRLSEMLGFEASKHVFSVSAALESVAGIPVLFVHGENDTKSAAPALAVKAREPKRLLAVAGANHHFTGQEETLRKELLAGIEWLRKAR